MENAEMLLKFIKCMGDKIDNYYSLELIFLFFFGLDFLDHLIGYQMSYQMSNKMSFQMGYQKMEFGLIRGINGLFYVDTQNEHIYLLNLIFSFLRRQHQH